MPCSLSYGPNFGEEENFMSHTPPSHFAHCPYPLAPGRAHTARPFRSRPAGANASTGDYPVGRQKDQVDPE